jgi:hypothetical protein
MQEKISGLNIPLPVSLKKRFKRVCLEKDIAMTSVALDLVKDWVEKNESRSRAQSDEEE